MRTSHTGGRKARPYKTLISQLGRGWFIPARAQRVIASDLLLKSLNFAMSFRNASTGKISKTDPKEISAVKEVR
jgi:hypothetical protein